MPRSGLRLVVSSRIKLLNLEEYIELFAYKITRITNGLEY